MNNKYEPCSICENYIEGVICDNDECPVAKMKAEIDRLRDIIRVTDETIKKACALAKSEAIKEFAEKLKANYSTLSLDDEMCVTAFVCDINRIEKEMKEGRDLENT